MFNRQETVQALRLADGRMLAYAEFGDPTGEPLFFFHGGNDSRLEAALVHETAQEMGVRVIAPDRPGYGRSDFQQNRTFRHWPADVVQLADALSLSRFAVMGHSGGGPHAAVVAWALPERVTSAALVSSAAPPGSSNRGMHPLFRMVNFFMGRSPRLHKRITQQNADQVRQSTDKFFTQWGMMQQADGRLFADNPTARALIAAEMQEAVSQGISGILQEHPLYKRPWGFALSEIAIPVHIWHGQADRQAAPAWSEYLAACLPDAVLRLVPDEGHFSVLVNWQTDILQTLLVRQVYSTAPE